MSLFAWLNGADMATYNCGYFFGTLDGVGPQRECVRVHISACLSYFCCCWGPHPQTGQTRILSEAQKVWYVSALFLELGFTEAKTTLSQLQLKDNISHEPLSQRLTHGTVVKLHDVFSRRPSLSMLAPAYQINQFV